MNHGFIQQPGRLLVTVTLYLLSAGVCTPSGAALALGKSVAIEKGQPIPSVAVTGTNREAVNLGSLKGHVTLISIVPQLNTPVCDEQTHRFSENNGSLDQLMIFITLSTNTSSEQRMFATKANIQNMKFLSDSPDYHFGTGTGLLPEQSSILQCGVLILDTTGIIRYVELVPPGQLPDFDRALRVSRTLLPTTSKE